METMRRCVVMMLALLVWTTAPTSAQSMQGDEYVLPPQSVQELFKRDKNIASLDRLSPDGDHFVIPQFQELTDLEQMSQRTLRLAMLEFVPEVNREWRLATYGNYGLNLYSLKERRTYPITLPPNVYVSDMRWSPDGARLAFVVHPRKSASQVWVAEVATGQARAISDAPVMATLMARPGGGGEAADSQGGRLLQWLPDGSLLTVLVPSDRGPEPADSSVPQAPIIRRSREKATPTSTQPFLLRTRHDEQLFKYYTTAQLAILTPGRAPRTIGKPAMYMDYQLSPDGRHVLRETIEEPFSYLAGFNGFGRRLEVIDLDGNVLAEVRKRPLQEAQTRGGDPAGDNLPREVAWRPDGKGLSMLWRERANGRDNPDPPLPKDRVMLLAPPFDMAKAQTIISTEDRLSDASYSKDGRYAFMTVARRNANGGGNRRSLTAYDLAAAEPTPFVLKGNFDPNDPVGLPGEIMTTATANGVVSAIVSRDGTAAFLKGDGYNTSFTPQPFIDRVVIRSAATTRLFEGSASTFDVPLVPLDQDMSRLIVSRESKTTVPDSYLWTQGSGQMENLTRNKDPYPEITAAQRVDFDFTRRDGVKVHARISLPVGYQPGTRVPAVFWTYPREFEDEAAYQRGAIRARNRNAYSPLSFLRWSDIWLTQGYALVYPDIPILGTDGRFNDNYRPNLEDTIYSAIRKVDELGYVDVNRIGHGGHSYGAFTTANLLAHTPFFKAGIAGDGAYNRTLTPMTFQGERRNFWEAPHTYMDMSSFFYADQITAPMLMYHGAQDNNSGTFLIQSERMMQALTGLGKTAVLYIYPFESHAPRARENFLDLWARWLEWFDKYVKDAGETKLTPTAQQ
jgi:dipeptidyl aminopeptidase/acylaminoacyl peptidase